MARQHWILTPKRIVDPQTAMDTVSRIRFYCQEDQKSTFKTLLYQWPIAVGAGLVTAGVLPQETTADTVKIAAATGLTASCAYLTQVISEVRKRLDNMRDIFEKAANNFFDHEQKLTRKLKDALNKPRDTFDDIVSFKKHPIRNTIAGCFEAAAVLAPIDPMSKMAIGLIGMNIALNGIVMDEDYETSSLYKTATRVKQYLLKVQEIRIKSPEMLDDLGVNLD